MQFLVDANLPYKFKLWKNDKFKHVKDLDDQWPDSQIWKYARENQLTIITKDADFSNRIITSDPPPKVIHLKVGNMNLSQLHAFLNKHWQEIEQMSRNHKLVNVYKERIMAVE